MSKTSRRKHLIGALMLAAFSLTCGAQAAPENDVVVLRNGDLFVGTVAQEFFSMTTAYGRIDIPYGNLAKLIFPNRNDEPVRLLTRSGERFSGTLEHRRLFVLRDVMGPSLRIATGEMARIEFGRHAIRAPAQPANDVMISRGGDHFRVRILTPDYLLRGNNGLRQLNRAQLSFLDLDRIEDDNSVGAQASFRAGSNPVSGTLMNDTILIRTLYGQELPLPTKIIESLGFDRISATSPRAGRGLALSTRAGAPGSLLHDQFDDDTPGPALVIVPARPYRRGDLQGDGDGDEQPPRQVLALRPFAIGLHPVTFEEYDRFCDEFGREKPSDEGWGRGRRPAINVSWEDAVAYTKWLSRKTGKTYRLPSDAEWEFAARGGSQSRFWWGDSALPGFANCADCGSLWAGEKSAPVAKFPPNPFGLYDMAGNVWEWTADCYGDKLSGYPVDGGPLEKNGCGKRVIRGGAWSFPAREMRSANRWRDFPSRRSDDTGFRVVRELED